MSTPDSSGGRIVRSCIDRSGGHRSGARRPRLPGASSLRGWRPRHPVSPSPSCRSRCSSRPARVRRGRCWSASPSPCSSLRPSASRPSAPSPSGSLGTYTGNGLGPGFAYAAGFSLLLGYIGFATTGTLGGVLYLDSFLESIGLGSQAAWFRLLLVIVVVAAAVVPAVPGCRTGGEVRVGLRADRHRVDSCDHRRCLHHLRLQDRLGAVESRASGCQRHLHRGGVGGGLLCGVRERRIARRGGQGCAPQHRPVVAEGGAVAGRALHRSPPIRRSCSSRRSTATRRCCRNLPTPSGCHGSTTLSARRSQLRSSCLSPR